MAKEFFKNKSSNSDEDAVFDLMCDDCGALIARVMGVYGAMVRGLSKADALAKYGLTEAEYDNNVERVING